MSESQAPAIMWFRQDLRLSDNPALKAAVDTGAPLLPVFILDDETAGHFKPGGASCWWLHGSLAELDASLGGGHLVLRRGKTAEILGQLIEETGARAIHAANAYEPYARKVEDEVQAACDKRKVAFTLHEGRLLNPPDSVATKDGRPYQVFTPYWKAAKRKHFRDVLKAPKLERFAKAKSEDLDDWQLRPKKPDWAGGLRETWTPGEAAAKEKLAAFIDKKLRDYEKDRGRLDCDPSSQLSPHLHFGELSPLQVYRAVRHAKDGAHGKGAESFLRELGWREFCYQLLFHFPHIASEPLKPQFADFPWRDAPDELQAWKRGETGYPIIDAAMRQLWQTGWMPNRTRMLVASFLTKHLMIPWQQGADWFWDTLVDADLANNAANWQWVAGCGADAAPYFRIFNPVLQAEKFDPDGRYIRAWIPELQALELTAIHAPWTAPAREMGNAGVELGRDYPTPIVDHNEGRRRALDAFERIKK
ncbi:deoxyribodipyrimidine photo-lyase [Methyloligella sp. 2.7D]|uniref:cryptochrome/photolyase family protein n=1 Tax=unclassified Methyloligella TaxID=2625955 RepID=UPI00157CFA8E|nr:deoxyribodipyrimidine photo-lyase [Methyloligella sp. GL2]QKP76442.1 deoxyribodipyrimidine photo-lyase [Methyloligella sp. GL2]